MELETLRLDVRNRIAVITLARPERLNAMNLAMWDELSRVCDVVAGRWPDEVRAAVFAAEGTAFCVGGDIDDFGTLTTESARTGYLRDVLDLYARIEALPVPTVAAVHGLALGGGCELTLVCDIVVADETAVFGLPETRIGLFPGVGVARGARQLNAHALKYLTFTGDRVDVARAAAMGLVDEVVAEGEALRRAEEVAGAIAAGAPRAIAAAKAIINAGSPRGYADSLDTIPQLMGTADHAEGLAAFAGRRSPEFSGE